MTPPNLHVLLARPTSGNEGVNGNRTSEFPAREFWLPRRRGLETDRTVDDACRPRDRTPEYARAQTRGTLEQPQRQPRLSRARGIKSEQRAAGPNFCCGADQTPQSLVRADARLAHDLAVTLGIALDDGVELLGRARRRDRALHFELFLHVRHREHRGDVLADLLEDRFRCAGRRHDAEP